jgi:hypothetical protein
MDEFYLWLSKGNGLKERFQLLANSLQRFLCEKTIINKDKAEQFLTCVPAVFEKCDDRATYELPLSAEAYAYVHLLHRYYRYILTYKHLIENGYMKEQLQNLQYLDIGTGPAPAIFALSDIVSLYRIYKNEPTNHLSPNREYDYVEASNAFRGFLHHFTEYANLWTETFPWQVPHHHGNFYNFETSDFRKINKAHGEWLQDMITKSISDPSSVVIYRQGNSINIVGKNSLYSYSVLKKNSFRYNLITSSYFFTNLDFIRDKKNIIKYLPFALIDYGIFINMGAVSSHYPQIHKTISKLIRNTKSNSPSIKIRNVHLLDHTFSSNDYEKEYIDIISKFYKDIYSHIEKFSPETNLPNRYKKIFLDHGKESLGGWFIQVFQKRYFPMPGNKTLS